MRKTKTVCTLGPATDDINILRTMMQKGMDVVRLNFSHGSQQQHKQSIDKVKKIREELGLPIAIMLDTKGPEIRTGEVEGGSVSLRENDSFILSCCDCVGDSSRVAISFPELKKYLKKGDIVFLDDGSVKLTVVGIIGDEIKCTVGNSGILGNRKSVNIPGVHIDFSYISKQDESDIIFGIENGVDFIAASFARRAADVLDVKKILEQHNSSIQIIAKIENSEGVNNADEILAVSDGIMVARGDLGIEMDFETIPHIQKVLIRKAYMLGKKVITATQMLESMMNSPRPTRAETTDVANAIYDGTSAIMLSGETAAGKYPVEALEAMCKIAESTEGYINYIKRFNENRIVSSNIADAISHATVTTAHDMGAAAVITVTKTGTTARMISKYRPECPIISFTTDEVVARQLNMSWGVKPFIINEFTNTDELFSHCVEFTREKGIVKNGDIVSITTGTPLGIPGTTNTLKVQVVGNILLSANGVTKKSVYARACVASSVEELRKLFREGDIIVISETSNDIMDILRKCGGIITEKGGFTSHAAVVGLSLDIPVITGANFASNSIKTGSTITMDGSTGIVYSGIVTE